MKKKSLILVLLTLLMCPSTWLNAEQGSEKSVGKGSASVQDTDTKQDLESFLKEFIEALKAKNNAQIEELVKKAPQFVYQVILEISSEGIRSVAEGKDETGYFNTAEKIATIYAKEFQKDGLVELVRKYKQYTLGMCQERLIGNDLNREGVALYEKGKWKEALARLEKALKIFQMIGDMAGDAMALGNIGVIYWCLGQYPEALRYHRRSLEIKRNIGDIAGEEKTLNNIGIVYTDLGRYTEALRYYQQSLEIVRKIRDVGGEASSLGNIGVVYNNLGQYTKALSCHLQSLEIVRRIGDVAREASILNNIGIVYNSLGQYTKALSYCQQSLEINRGIGDVAGESKSLGNIGMSYKNLGQYAEALRYFQQSLEIVRKIADLAGEALCLGNIGVIYECLSQYPEALRYHQQSLDINRKIGNVAGEAGSLKSIGNVYNSLSQYPEALRYHQQSLDIKRKIGNVAGEAGSLSSIGDVYYGLGQYTEALGYYQQSLEIDRKIGNVAGEAGSLRSIGNGYYSLGQYTEALGYYQQSLEIDRKIGNVAGEARSLGGIGIIYNKLGQHTEALSYHGQSLEIKRKIGDVRGEAESLNGIGNVYYWLGRYTEALGYYQQSLDINRKIRDVGGESTSLGNIGLIYDSLSQYIDGLRYHQQSLEIKRKIGDVSGEATILNNIGIDYHDLGQYNKAIEPFQESIRISEKIGALETVWKGYRGLGDALWKSGKGEEAIGWYGKAIGAIEKLYAATKGLKEEERSSMMGDKSFVYKQFIELLLELHRKSPSKAYDKEAFLISEKSKSRTFQELMAKAGAKIAFVGDETFKKMSKREQQLIIEVTNLRNLLTQELSKPEKQRKQEVIDSLKAQLAQSEKSLNDLEKEIEVKYPRYSDLKRPKPLTVEELQNILKPDETLISYAVGKDKIAAFVIGKKNFKLIEMGISREELSKLIRRFRRGLEDVREVKDLEKFKPEEAYELYRKVFSPLSSELKGVTKLYISADDILYTLPFEALVDKEINEKVFDEARERGGVYLSEYNTLHYLIDTYTITYLPSVSVLRSLRKYEKPGYGRWSRALIAFADPIFSEEDRDKVKDKVGVKEKEVKQKGVSQETQLTVQILTRSTGNEKLERLKESAQEAEAISKELKGRKEDIYLRERATEENIYKTNLRDSRYVLFSTHGLLGGDFSGVAEPALALTLIDNPPGRDGFLTMSEVLGLDLNSELIILSACNTSGRGDKSGSGEGFVGLTRSFMYAGSKSLLVTHWSVESEAARDLMVGAMKLMRNKTKPDALRGAKLNMKRSVRQKGNEKISLSHPFFWAPFVLVGEGK